MSEYGHARADLDPLGLVRLPDGSDRGEIELTLSNDPDREAPSLADPVCSLDVDRARQLAQRLLVLAWQSEHRQRSGVRR